MKKVLGIVLAMCMISGVLGGCGSSSTSKPASTPATASGSAKAESAGEVKWPTGDVTVYIPNPAGSNLDLSSRILLDYLNKTTGRTFIPTNEVTGMGTLALQKLAAAKPDGLTIMMTGSGSNIQYHTGEAKSSTIDESKYTIIAPAPGATTDIDSVLVTTPKAPYKTFDELKDYIEKNPGKVKYATSSGTTVEIKAKLLTERFGLTDKVKMVYATNPELPTGLLGGHIDVAVLSGITARQYLEAGSMIALMHFKDSYKGNDKYLLNVPDLEKLKCKDLYSTYPMYIIGPAKMDPNLVKKMNETMGQVIKQQEYVKRWADLKSEYVPMDPKAIRDAVIDMDKKIESIYKKK